jgi:hypothetical protein
MKKDFSIKTFGVAIDLSRVSIWRMIKEGQLHAYKVRNATRIPYSELARIQTDNQIKPSPNKRCEHE